MKFKFCGDNDCQDWLLAQISLLSKLTSIKIKIVLKEVINHMFTGQLDLDKVCKLTTDAKLTDDETKGVIAALNFIITSSAKYNTDSDVVSNELQQLGLPREHSVALCKAYSDNLPQIKEALKANSLKYYSLKNFSYEVKSTFNTDYGVIKCPALICNINEISDQQPVSETFYMPFEQLDCLIKDIKEALQISDSVTIQ